MAQARTVDLRTEPRASGATDQTPIDHHGTVPQYRPPISEAVRAKLLDALYSGDYDKAVSTVKP